MRTRLRKDALPAAAALMAAIAAVAVARAQDAPDAGSPGATPGGAMHDHRGGPGGPGATDGPPDQAVKPTPVNGTVQSYNRDGRGHINGLVISDGNHTLQLNTPPDWGDLLTKAAPLKESVSGTAVPERVVGDRTIERLVSLDGQGKTLTVPQPGQQQTVHVDGTVSQLNYSPRGELDGAMLDTGDFVHTGPEAAAMLNLAVGQKLSADGWAAPMADGHQAIEADTVNGTHVPRPPRPPHGRPGGSGGPGGPGMDDGGGPGGPRAMRGPGPDGGPPAPPEGPDGAAPPPPGPQ